MVTTALVSPGAVGPGEVFFDIKLVWLNSEEAARYLRKTVGALRTAVCRGYVRARKWKRRLYFKREELDALLNNSQKLGGF
ncbi:MAG: helix-turn-helix domain-containing protein [Bdellovibrionales bacterium]|nr:helix-turn-helix domain-containing protein [Bdellovibrionales bacterium]